MSKELAGKGVAILVTDGFEEVEMVGRSKPDRASSAECSLFAESEDAGILPGCESRVPSVRVGR
jgi:hypothetical protein